MKTICIEYVSEDMGCNGRILYYQGIGWSADYNCKSTLKELTDRESAVFAEVYNLDGKLIHTYKNKENYKESLILGLSKIK